MTGLYCPVMKIAVSIPDELFAAGDRLAARRGISRSELYATALAHELAGADDGDVTAALDAVYDGSSGAFDADLAESQRELLAREP